MYATPTHLSDALLIRAPGPGLVDGAGRGGGSASV